LLDALKTDVSAEVGGGEDVKLKMLPACAATATGVRES
jgi:hypothetical protein